MQFKEKVVKAQVFIRDCLLKYNNPAIMCSFGKDSTVLLHLITTTIDSNLPVVFFRHPGQNKKYEFADTIIHKLDLEVYNYPPSFSWFLYRAGRIDGYDFMDMGGEPMAVAMELVKPTGGKFYCALNEMANMPTAKEVEYPWGLTFHGHKSCDCDPIVESVPLKQQELRLGSTVIAYPLKDWLHEDVWEYTERFNVPYEARRYDKTNGYEEFENKDYNTDYHYACTDCLMPDATDMVWCERVKKMVKNISHKMNYEENLELLKQKATYIDFKGVQNA